jgi:uncharacterized protein with HEPN domain
MAPRKIRPVLAEIIEALDGIEAAMAGKTFEDFEADWLLKHGVQRGIEIISEASRHIPDDLLALAPEIPWKQVRGIGSVLGHEYQKIADSIVWTAVTDNLPPLRKAIEHIQASVEGTQRE